MEKQLTARKRQALEMRSRIQNVALDLFDRDGFENVSVEQIAQAAGCSVGNIYHYFKSKDELIIHVTSSVDAQYEVLEQNYLADTGISARSKLLDFVGRSLDISCKDPSLYRSFIHGLKYPEQAILRDNDSRVYFRVLRETLPSCATRRSWWPIWWRSTAACCSSGASTNRASIWCTAAAGWPLPCWTAGVSRKTESAMDCKCCFAQRLRSFFVRYANFSEMPKTPLTSGGDGAIM